MIDRRTLIGGSMAGALSMTLPGRIALARLPIERRFVFIIQRGAADGLAIVAPTGDPALMSARSALAAESEGGARLDSMFTLHPALVETGKLYGQGQALFGHALASAYRNRSHFDGQNVLETGGARAYAEKSGWMNRMLALLPEGDAAALAVAQAVPMALRGDRPVSSYAPSALPGASEDLIQRVSALYEQDAQLDRLWQSALSTRALTDDLAGAKGRNGQALGELAARLLAPADGARVMMIETGGWDTHSGQKGRLAAQLRGLDLMIAALRAGLGPAWDSTTVLVATEFGRTVAANGTGGTDHGTAGAAMLLGGQVKGGRIVADWPGLSQAALFEGRDLKPTASLESFIAGAVAGHYAIDPARAARGVYPALAGLRPMEGLVVG